MSECILATLVYDINVRLFKENVCVHFCDAGVDMYFCDVIMRVIKGAIVDTCTHAHMLLALGTKLGLPQAMSCDLHNKSIFLYFQLRQNPEPRK